MMGSDFSPLLRIHVCMYGTFGGYIFIRSQPSREYTTSIMTKGLVSGAGIDGLKWQRPLTKGK